MTMKTMRVAAFLLIGLFVAALSGCNTMRGFGKDVETVGEAIQKKSTR
ncbi:MAG TPA: entericidin A/B family lipoprotein [Burkholderiales bacterium]|nr:entericidin A/B family lipoprotein [Burkholderiales bacterium]